jgi:hypothetical protein
MTTIPMDEMKNKAASFAKKRHRYPKKERFFLFSVTIEFNLRSKCTKFEQFLPQYAEINTPTLPGHFVTLKGRKLESVRMWRARAKKRLKLKNVRLNVLWIL